MFELTEVPLKSNSDKNEILVEFKELHLKQSLLSLNNMQPGLKLHPGLDKHHSI